VDIAPVTKLISDLGYGFFLFAATLMMTVYWTLDADRVTRALLLRAPAEKRDGFRELIAELEGKVGSYFRGQLILCGSIFAISTVAFFAIGLPWASSTAFLKRCP
jgi:predicted PurR-regulated permease PerM